MLETFQPEKVKIDSGKGGDDVTGRVDGLLWYTVLEDHSRLDSGPLSSLDSGPQGTFVGIYDGHGGPQDFAGFIGNNNAIPQPATEKQVYWENPLESGLNSGKTENNNRSPKGLFSKARKHTSESQSPGSSSGLPVLRRCQSFSTAACHSGRYKPRNRSCLNDQSRSPCSNKSNQLHSSRHRTPTSERQSKEKQFEVEAMRNAHGLEVPGSAGSSRQALREISARS